MQASPAKYNLARPTPAECNSARPGRLRRFLYGDRDGRVPRGCCFQGLCLIGETPMQASPAKYNLALPTTPAEYNLACPGRLRHICRCLGSVAFRTIMNGFIKELRFFLHRASSYAKLFGGLSDDAVGDAEFA